eukprot:15607_1
MSQIQTNEGDNGENELIEWLTTNKLLKAKQQILEFEVSLQELKEYNIQYLDSFIKDDLKLTGMMANRFSKAVKKLQTQPTTQPITQIIRTVVLSKEEDAAMRQISNAYNNTTQYLKTLNNNINTLNTINKQNENKINQFQNEIINKIKTRMNELKNKSNTTINKKKQQIASHMNKIQQYHTTLASAQSEQKKLINDPKLDSNKRKTKIVNINKQINHKIMQNNPQFNTSVTIEFDTNKIFTFVENIGHVNDHSYPNAPVFSVNNVTESTAIIKFNQRMNPLLEYTVEIDNIGSVDDDEKKTDWQQLITLKNKKTYLCSNLADGKQYKVRARCKNKYGYSPYSNIVSFKTKKIVIDSVILTSKEKNIFVALMKSSGKNVGGKFSLLYRASRDGWTANDFHGKCDNKGKTVALIHTDINNVFGGYASIPWTSKDQSIADKNAFLFLIRSSKDYKPQIFNLLPNNENVAVSDFKDMLCEWGSESDISICANCHQNKSSGTQKYAYNIPQKHYLNGDVKKFKVTEIEVFKTE